MANMFEQANSNLVAGKKKTETAKEPVVEPKKPEAEKPKKEKNASAERKTQIKEGGQTPLARRLPKLPGFRNVNQIKYTPVNVSRLEDKYKSGETVDVDTLLKYGIINSDKRWRKSFTCWDHSRKR